MPYTALYSYPNADNESISGPSSYWYNSPGGGTGNLYASIDEGFSNFNDNDSIVGQIPDFSTNVLSFYLSDINFEPSSITDILVRIRYAGRSYNSCHFGSLQNIEIYDSGNNIVANSGTSFYVSGSSGGWPTDYMMYATKLKLNTANIMSDWEGTYLKLTWSGIQLCGGFGSALPRITALDVLVSGNTWLNENQNHSMFIQGYDDINSDTVLYISGDYSTFNKTTLYTGTNGTINDNVLLSISGTYSDNSGIPLYIQLCSRAARLQPLYDNEFYPNPIESGYGGWLSSNSLLYNGIDNNTRWGFYSTLEQNSCTDKYHFNVDEFDNDIFSGINFKYAPYADEDLVVQFDYNAGFGFLYGNTTGYSLTNSGFTIYNNNSGHLGYSCGYFVDTALFNNTQNNGYGYHNDISIGTINNSGMIFDNQNYFYIWFNIIDNGNSGDRTCLFSIGNSIASFNPPHPYNQIAVYFEEGSKLLTVKDDYTEQIIVGGLASGWHLLACNVTRTSYNNIATAWYFDGSLINNLNLVNNVSSPIHAYDGKLFYIGKHFNDSNIGNISFLSDFFGYSDESLSSTAMEYLYNFYRRIQRPTNNYFNHIGCSGYTEILCDSNCSDRTWGDSDYLYSQPPERGDNGWCYSPSPNYIYYYDGSNSSFTTYQTHNIVDFQSRGLDLAYGPYDTYLRFRADIDTRFKVKNISITDENGNILSQKVNPIELDGYGTCGPYEIQLDTSYFSSGTFNPTRTKIYADFYVDTGCLGFRYPTGLVHASQTDNNFRNQYRNMRTLYNGSIYIQESGYGITNNHIQSEYTNGTPDTYHSQNTFGYEYSGINDTTHQKWLGIRLTNYYIWSYSGGNIDLVYYLYTNYNSGNSYSGAGSFSMCTVPQANFTSGDIIYWSQLPTNIGTGDFQIGFYFSNDNYDGNLNENLDIQLGSAPFVYLDMTNKGIDRLGQIKITQLDVAFEVPCNPTGINDVITLYTAGVANTGIDIPLYTSGMPHGYGYGTLFIDGAITEELPLYIKGGLTANMPLYINGFGGTETKNLTLFLAAEESGVDYGTANNTQTLYIKSVPVASGEGFDLYIAGPDSGYMYENIPLYIEGYGGSSTDATALYIQALESGIDYGYGIGTSYLYLNGIAANSGDPFSLYISAPTSGYLNDNMPLYLNNLDAWTGLNSGTDLYIQTLESGNRLTTLFINSFGEISGDPFNLHISGGIGTTTLSNTLYVNGEQAWRDNITLFLANATPVNDILNLYVKGTGNLEVGYRTLFISGDVDDVNNVGTLFISGEPFPFVSGELLNLYINGGGIDNRTDIVDLYLYAGGDIPYLNSVNLHIIGGFEYGEFPLSLYNNDTPILRNKTATLFTNGFSGVLGKLEQGCIFYIDGTIPNDSMNLYLYNSGIHSHYNTYPLYLGGKDITYSGIANWNTLYIQNEYLHIDYGCEMYLNSQEAYKESGDFNLFIARSTEAIAGNTNLYLAATNGATSEFAMYISGSTYSQNNVNLSIPYVESTIINNAKLYTHGF